jgi:hypothetical protein
LPRMIQFQAGDTFAVEQHGGLSELPELAAARMSCWALRWLNQ